MHRSKERVTVKMIRTCHEAKRRPNLILLLVTEGGDPDAAYRISRYEKFSCLVSGYCKSAGTLLLLGANQLIFSEHGEIGPLEKYIFTENIEHIAPKRRIEENKQ
jgi:hypothetical protein